MPWRVTIRLDSRLLAAAALAVVRWERAQSEKRCAAIWQHCSRKLKTFTPRYRSLVERRHTDFEEGLDGVLAGEFPDTTHCAENLPIWPGRAVVS